MGDILEKSYEISVGVNTIGFSVQFQIFGKPIFVMIFWRYLGNKNSYERSADVKLDGFLCHFRLSKDLGKPAKILMKHSKAHFSSSKRPDFRCRFRFKKLLESRPEDALVKLVKLYRLYCPTI